MNILSFVLYPYRTTCCMAFHPTIVTFCQQNCGTVRETCGSPDGDYEVANNFFWDVAPCTVVKNLWIFRRNLCLFLQRTMAAGFAQTSVSFRHTTRRRIPVQSILHHHINPLPPNDHYSGRTAPLTSKSCILYIYSTNIDTEYFKHGIYSTFFFLKM